MARLESLLEHSFPEFRTVRPNGDVRWDSSWSGKNIRELATLSSRRLRVDQYEQLFSIWSEQTHASPGALIDSFAQEAGENWLEEVVARDDVRIAEMVTIAISLFLELWHLLPNVPRIDVARFTGWTASLIAEARKHGAPEPLPANESGDG